MRRIEGLVYDDDPRQGYTVGQTYYHPVLAFKVDFPDQWQIINQRQAVGALSPNRDAAVVLTLSDKDSPRAAFEAFFSQQGVQRGSNQGRNLYSLPRLRPTDRCQQSGRPDRFSQPRRPGVSAHGIHRRRDLAELFAERCSIRWRASQRVTERRYLEVEPKTIDVVTLPRAMTLTEFARRFPSNAEVSDLAILNGVSEDTVLEKGAPRQTDRRRQTADAR